jgi:hypothetical protein
MESISDFWKSARERFTNPFAFAYLVSWFTFNWKITVALFFTDVPYSQLYWIVNHELEHPSTYLVPLILAIVYVVFVAFIRQVVSEMNIRFDKWGTARGIKASGGGKVSVDKYLKEREKLEIETKKLEEIFEKETKSNEAYEELEKKYNSMQFQYIESGASVANLRKTVNELSEQVTYLTPFEFQAKTLNEQLVRAQITLANLHDTKLIDGVWKVLKNEQNLYAEEYVVVIDNGVYSTDDYDTPMNMFFYDDRGGSLTFQINPTGRDIRANNLDYHNKDFLIGRENIDTIQYQRVEGTTIEKTKEHFAMHRAMQRENQSNSAKNKPQDLK